MAVKDAFWHQAVIEHANKLLLTMSLMPLNMLEGSGNGAPHISVMGARASTAHLPLGHCH